jgi:hypothetical protein
MQYQDGTYTARSVEELQEMLAMATGGSPRMSSNPTLGLDSPVVAAASTFLPGGGAPGFSVTGNGMVPDGPARTPVGYGTAGVRSQAAGIGSKINDVRRGYEAGVQPLVQNQTRALQGLIPQGPIPAKGGIGMKAGRMAGAAIKNPLLQKGLAYAPAIGTALAVGDVVLGDESLGNKAMDAAAMGVGGFLGSAVPVVGTGLGIAAGKMVSDGTQWLFGDKKTPEQRKMELALAQLQGIGVS